MAILSEISRVIYVIDKEMTTKVLFSSSVYMQLDETVILIAGNTRT